MPVVLVSFGRLALLSPVVNLRRRAARRAGDGRRRRGAGGRWPRAGRGAAGHRRARRCAGLGRSSASWSRSSRSAPACRSRASTLEPPLDVVAARLGPGAWPAWSGRAVRRRPPARRRAGGTRADAGVADGGEHRGPASSAGRAVARLGASGAISLIGSLLVAGAVVAATARDGARISVLDVGQGDAILVEGVPRRPAARRRRPRSRPAAGRPRPSGSRRGTAGSTR